MAANFRNQFARIALLIAAIALPASGQGRKQLRSSTGGLSSSALLTRIAQGKAMGISTAPIKIEDFTDFECPACRALYLQTLRPLIDQYVSSGKVYLVHHDFPLPMHPYSHMAADYADAAAAIGKFAPVENALFTSQPQWTTNGRIQPFLAGVLSAADLKKVEELASTEQVQEAVQDDFHLGQQLGVHETPTMYIIHKGQRTPIIGVVSFAILSRYLDALLRR